MLSVFGIAVFVLIYGGMLRTTSRRWRYLAKTYAAESKRPAQEEKHMQSVVLIGLGGYNSLKGIVTIGVHLDGVSLRVMPLFSLFHAPLFIPYSDLRGWGTSWYLDADSTELEFRQAPDVKIVVPTEQAQWIKRFSGGEMTVREVSPPEGNAGRGWYYFSLVNAGFSLGALAWLGWFYLSGPTL